MNLPRLFFKQNEIIGSTMGSYEEFEAVSALVEQGLAVHIDHTYSLADYGSAIARLDEGEQLGKIVLTHEK